MTIEAERAALRALVANVRAVLSGVTKTTKPAAAGSNPPANIPEEKPKAR